MDDGCAADADAAHGSRQSKSEEIWTSVTQLKRRFCQKEGTRSTRKQHVGKRYDDVHVDDAGGAGGACAADADGAV